MSLQALALQALAYFSGVASPRAERRVEEACAECALKLGHALGPPWQRCVIELLQGYEDDEFSLSDFSYSPLTALPGAGRANGELLKNLMRNFTCDFEDGGSQPLRTMTWQYQERDPCAGASATEQARSFTYKAGYLPAGDELTELNGLMSEAEAEAACLASPGTVHTDTALAPPTHTLATPHILCDSTASNSRPAPHALSPKVEPRRLRLHRLRLRLTSCRTAPLPPSVPRLHLQLRGGRTAAAGRQAGRLLQVCDRGGWPLGPVASGPAGRAAGRRRLLTRLCL